MKDPTPSDAEIESGSSFPGKINNVETGSKDGDKPSPPKRPPVPSGVRVDMLQMATKVRDLVETMSPGAATSLNLDTLRRINAARSEESYGLSVGDWTMAQWALAASGEMGELCGAVKDIERENLHPGTVGGFPILADRVADEIADVIIYLDLLAARMGRSLTDIIRTKFNATSAARCSPFTLEPSCLERVSQLQHLGNLKEILESAIRDHGDSESEDGPPKMGSVADSEE